MTNLVIKDVTISMVNGGLKGKPDIVIRRKVMKQIVKDLMETRNKNRLAKPTLAKPSHKTMRKLIH